MLPTPNYSLRYYCHDNAYWDRCRIAEASSSNEYPNPSLREQLTQHHTVLDLLERIKQHCDIQYELFPVPSVIQDESIFSNEEAEAVIYGEHFAPRASILNPRNEGTVPETWRSNRGHYFVVDRVAILENTQVGWVTQSNSSFKRFPPPVNTASIPLQPEIVFLQAVYERGIDLIHELCFPVTTTPEQTLTDSFLTSAIVSGEFRREVKVDWKAIDLVCQSTDGTWILEVEQRLSWAAFGQAVGYGWLYARAHPTETVFRGIVCGISDDTIETICAAPEFAVTVFLATDQGFVRRGYLPEGL